MAPTADRRDVYQDVTDRIIAQLEAGIFPWAQPWDSAKANPIAGSFGLPSNPTTGAFYSGINVLLLWMAGTAAGFSTQRWMTLKQANGIGATVRKGERSIQIVHCGSYVPKGERVRAQNEDRDPGASRFIKFFNVFNVDQIDGFDEPTPETPRGDPLIAVDERVRAMLTSIGVRYVIGTAKACYIPASDTAQLPAPDAFFEPIDWHRTALHELGHATGAKHRLDRDLTNGFGSEGYAREELIAELTAAYACAALSIRPTVRHADYIGSWLTILRNDKKCVVQAASAASKASEYLLRLASLDRSGQPLLAVAEAA